MLVQDAYPMKPVFAALQQERITVEMLQDPSQNVIGVSR